MEIKRKAIERFQCFYSISTGHPSICHLLNLSFCAEDKLGPVWFSVHKFMDPLLPLLSAEKPNKEGCDCVNMS